jgi:hypothetical protein
MERRVLHPQRRENLSETPYPFCDTATLTAESGEVLLWDAFADAIIHPVGGQLGLRLSQVDVTNQEVVLWIGDSITDQLASGSFDPLDPPDVLKLSDTYGRPAGVLVAGASGLAVFQTWSTGSHRFAQTATEFVVDCCVPTPEPGVRGFLLADGSLFTNDVWLVGEDGVVLRAETETIIRPEIAGGNQEVTVIRVDVVGDPLFRRNICGVAFDTPKFLRTVTVLNGEHSFVCGPDAMGDFKVTAGHQDAEDTILRIRSTPEGLVVEAVGETLQGVR